MLANTAPRKLKNSTTKPTFLLFHAQVLECVSPCGNESSNPEPKRLLTPHNWHNHFLFLVAARERCLDYTHGTLFFEILPKLRIGIPVHVHINKISEVTHAASI